MRLPPDWDKPSPENKELCEKFTYGTFDYSGILPYRLFIPDCDEKVPLVVYLHGADAFGKDNELQLSIHDIGTVFARADWQKKHPCYVLAPQCKQGKQWSDLMNSSRICALINKLQEQHTNIDPHRVYLYGYSAGGIGSLGIIKYHPEVFAAVVPICGATGRDNLMALTKTPIWLIHAADDQVVKASFKEGNEPPVHLGSRDIYEELKNIHPDIHYTEYLAGDMKATYGINPHCSWVPAGRDEEVKNWLFSKEK